MWSWARVWCVWCVLWLWPGGAGAEKEQSEDEVELNRMYRTFAGMGVGAFRKASVDPVFRDSLRWRRPGGLAEKLEVHASLLLRSLQEIRSDESAATLNFQLRLRWRDADLVWDASRPGAPLAFQLPRSLVWTPTTELGYNAIRTERGSEGEEPVVELWPDGTVHTLDSLTATVAVDLKTRDFPYDTQDVDVMLTLGLAWARLLPDSLTLEDQYEQLLPIFPNTEWDFRQLRCQSGETFLLFPNAWDSGEGPPEDSGHWLRCNPENEEQKAGGCQAPGKLVKPERSISFLFCRLKASRKAGFYAVNFVVPAVMITLLSISGQFTHELRASATSPPNKTQVGLAAVMSLGVLTVAMGNSVPKDESMTRLHLFYFINILLAISAALTSSIRLPALFRPTRPPSSKAPVPDVPQTPAEPKSVLGSVRSALTNIRSGLMGGQPKTKTSTARSADASWDLLDTASSLSMEPGTKTTASWTEPTQAPSPEAPKAEEPPERVKSPLWQWRAMLGLFLLHLLVFLSSLVSYLAPLRQP